MQWKNCKNFCPKVKKVVKSKCWFMYINSNEMHLMHINWKFNLKISYEFKIVWLFTSTIVNTLPSLQNSVKSIRTGTPSSKSSSGLPSMSFPVPGPLPLFDEFFCCSSSTRWAASAAFPLWLFAATSVSGITWRSKGRKKLLILANFPDAF